MLLWLLTLSESLSQSEDAELSPADAIVVSVCESLGSAELCLSLSSESLGVREVICFYIFIFSLSLSLSLCFYSFSLSFFMCVYVCI